MHIIYPPDFVASVEREYSDHPEICELARDSKHILGKFLAEGANKQMCPEEILEAFDSNDVVSVVEDAKAAIRRKRLHMDWLKMMVMKLEDAPAGSRRRHLTSVSPDGGRVNEPESAPPVRIAH